MIDENITDLAQTIKKEGGDDRLFMSFSTGVDSLAMWLRCLESGQFDPKKAVLYYYYYIPGMTWIDEYIEYFEDLYGVEIIQVPSSILLSDFANWLHQTPGRVEGIKSLEGTDLQFCQVEKDKMEGLVKGWAGFPEAAYTAIGVKSGDSAMRRIAMRRNRGKNEGKRKWYPIWDFENRDAENIIRKHGIKVPYDYKLFGITFENIDYRFSKVIKEQCPANWKHMLDFFPMAESIITRHEYYHPEWKLKKGVKYKKYFDIALEPRGEL